MKMRISTKLMMLLLLAALLPLAVFGAVSLWQVRAATVRSVTEGNANVSRRAAEEIDQYVRNALTILQSTAENMSHADLQDWQRERILKNYINRFDEFNVLSIRDPNGRLVATSALEAKPLSPVEEKIFREALTKTEGPTLSSVFIKDDLTPAMAVGISIRRLTEVSGVLLAELNLLHMWYLVDSIKIGKQGILHVLDPENRFIATGDGARKKEVFQETSYEPARVLPEILEPSGKVFVNPMGVQVLAVGTRLQPPLRWTVIVSQPTSEAYALATRISYVLAGVTVLMILIALAFGYWGGKQNVVDPIRSLMLATQELARGNLEYRVAVDTGDEFALLGDAFNRMAVRLKEVQARLIQEERHALFGRIASGLAHDLKHPFQAIENVSRLMEKMYDDAGFRETFRKTVEREFGKVDLFLQNLHNLTHEIPYRPLPLSLVHVVRDAWETFEIEAKKQGIGSELRLPEVDARIEGDRVALNRVLSNLISNAIQAMSAGGKLTLSASVYDTRAIIEVKDTGMGIPPERISKLFDDFVTTKRRGLGLGLAITRKIVEQHQGQIDVQSRVGEGTVFTIRLPLAKEDAKVAV